MTQLKKCTAIRGMPLKRRSPGPARFCLASLLLGAFCLVSGSAWAAPAGTVTNLSGPLLVTRADGTHKILVRNSIIESGDTLVTQKRGYAQIRFSDDSRIILQPDTTLAITQFSYDAAKPADDAMALVLGEGGVRSTAGQLGKRSKDRATLTTPIASIALQDASVLVQYRAPDPALALQSAGLAWLFASTAVLDLPQAVTRTDIPSITVEHPLVLAQITPPKAPTGGLAPGLYVQVLNGQITVNNSGGTQNFTAGQFGYTATVLAPPVMVPVNPGMQFTPPPVFSAPTGTSTSASSKAAAVDCVVR